MEICVQSGAKVIKMILGGAGPSASVQTFLTQLEIDGTDVLNVAAAGNGGDVSYNFPALYDCPLVMSVATVDINGERAPFSQYNNQIDIDAPGVGKKSTVTINSGANFDYTT
eukprot:9083520-Ditylum_brightwellii.AAC.1